MCEAKPTQFKRFVRVDEAGEAVFNGHVEGLYCRRCQQGLFAHWRPWNCVDVDSLTKQLIKANSNLT